MGDIAGWLEQIGLAKYGETFRVNAIDFDVLAELDENELKELGLPMGDRKRLLRAIAELKETAANRSQDALAVLIGPSAERRQLTVLFVDLVGSTALSQTLDPEDLRDVIRRYSETVAETIRAGGGFVAKFMGDGVLAYFGYPQATEDAAERAVRASLRVIAAIKTLPTAWERPLAVRAGIATGPVVVGDVIGDDIAREVNVVGETPNVAARLLALAKPDSVVIGEATRRMVGGLFELVALGPQIVKGIAAPITAYEVTTEHHGLSRFEAIRTSQGSQFIGRTQELALLLYRWELAIKGDSQLVLLSGEAGLGKSRLVDVFCRRSAEQPHTRLQYQCSPQHTNSSLYPVIEELTRSTGIKLDDLPSAKLDKLSTSLGAFGVSEQDIRLIASLLAIKVDTTEEDVALTSAQRRERVLSALVTHLEVLTQEQPLLLVVEDAHWIDPTTEELISRLVGRMGRLNAMALVTFRPEYNSPWQQSPLATQVMLNRLPRTEVLAMLTALADSKALPEAATEHILSRTDGVPLFIEEMFQGLQDTGMLVEEATSYRLARAVDIQVVPGTLQDSLMARLDRLAPAKAVAQTGAVIGREFSYSLLEAVAAMDEAALRAALRSLVDAGLVFVQGDPPDAIYTFKHALVQDAAHQSLLRSPRQKLHARLASVLVSNYPDQATSHPEIIALHYDQAGIPDDAAQNWLRAGLQALGKSASMEAVSLLQRGLESVHAIESGPTRAKLEVGLLIALGQANMTARGYASDEAIEAYSHAERICKEFGYSNELGRILVGSRTTHHVRGNFQVALQVASECLSVSSEINDDILSIQAKLGMAHTLCYMGRFIEAAGNVAEVLVRYDRSRQQDHLRHNALDPMVFALSIAAWNEWFLGNLDQSVSAAHEAIAFAKEFGNPLNQEHAFSSAARLYLLRREPETMRLYLDAAVSIAQRYGFKMRIAITKTMKGWLACQQGEYEIGVSHTREALAEYRLSGGRADLSWYLLTLATALHGAGQTEEAFATLAQAERYVPESGESWWAAEIARLKGDFCLDDVMGRRSHEAETNYRQALEIARRQQAKSWALRSAVSLARLLCSRDSKTEATLILRPIFEEFSEGANTPDIKQAKALLDELSAADGIAKT